MLRLKTIKKIKQLIRIINRPMLIRILKTPFITFIVTFFVYNLGESLLISKTANINSYIIGIIITALIFGYLIFWLYRNHLLSLNKPNKKNILNCIYIGLIYLFCILFYISFNFLINEIQILLGLTSNAAVTKNQTEIIKMYNYSINNNKIMFLFLIITECLIAPVMEELMFRGVIQAYNTQRHIDYEILIILFTAAFFGLFHILNFLQDSMSMKYILILFFNWIQYCMLGLILGLLYKHKHNLNESILFHILLNSLSVILTLYSI